MRRPVAISMLLILAACSSSEPQPNPVATDALGATLATDDSGDPPGKLWNTKQYTDRRTCPSDKCGVLGQLVFREAADPLERKGGWVRTTKYYDASCANGQSEYVKKGNAACTASNGFRDGTVAEWVRADQLSEKRPPDPADEATLDEQLVKDSDDFNLYHAQFAKLAKALIDSGRCTAAEFIEQGGFVKSVNRQDEPVYFVYCGGMTQANKVVVNAKTVTVE